MTIMQLASYHDSLDFRDYLDAKAQQAAQEASK
jgi:hypothetical protein